MSAVFRDQKPKTPKLKKITGTKNFPGKNAEFPHFFFQPLHAHVLEDTRFFFKHPNWTQVPLLVAMKKPLGLWNLVYGSKGFSSAPMPCLTPINNKALFFGGPW